MQTQFSFPKPLIIQCLLWNKLTSVLSPVLFTSEKNCKGIFSAALALIYKAWMTSGSYCSSGNIIISILWWSRGNLLYHYLCHHGTVISSLTSQSRMKEKPDWGNALCYLHDSTATHQDYHFLLIQRENTRGNKRKNYPGIYWWLSDRENKLQQVSLFSCKQSNHFNIRTSKALQRTAQCPAGPWLLLHWGQPPWVLPTGTERRRRETELHVFSEEADLKFEQTSN